MRILFLINFLSIILIGHSQNLVPNFNFNHQSPKDNLSTIKSVSNWFSANGTTPDLRQKDGDFYVGFYTFCFKPNRREYLCVKLNESLVDTLEYKISYKAMLRTDCQFALGHMSALFEKERPSFEKYSVIDKVPQSTISNELFMKKTGQWFVVSDTFKVSGGEQYLLLGNFFSDDFSGKITFEEYSWNYAYYYIDSVVIESFEPKKLADIDATKPTNLTLDIDSNFTLFSDSNRYIININKVDTFQIEKNKRNIIKNISFAINSSELLNTSFTELNKWVDFLKDNPNLKVEIIGHTDSTGIESKNITLSKERAQSVKNYFVNNGVNNIITVEGKGSQEPITNNKTEKGRAENRRVEIKIFE